MIMYVHVPRKDTISGDHNIGCVHVVIIDRGKYVHTPISIHVCIHIWCQSWIIYGRYFEVYGAIVLNAHRFKTTWLSI